MADPWWMTALRGLAVLGMGWGAWEGWRRHRAEKRARQDVEKAPKPD